MPYSVGWVNARVVDMRFAQSKRAAMRGELACRTSDSRSAAETPGC
jgi:hypothetical protein